MRLMGPMLALLVVLATLIGFILIAITEHDLKKMYVSQVCLMFSAALGSGIIAFVFKLFGEANFAYTMGGTAVLIFVLSIFYLINILVWSVFF